MTKDELEAIVRAEEARRAAAASPQEAATAVPEEEPQADAPDAPEAETSVLGDMATGAMDTVKGIAGGVYDGVEETLETVQWAGEAIGEKLTDGNDMYWTEDDGFEWLTQEEAKARTDIPGWQTKKLFGDGGHIDVPDLSENETVVGGLTRGIAQFATGYALLGKQAAVGKSVIAKGMTGGAVTDFVAFDAHEDRFADFLEQSTPVKGPIIEYLKADPEDSIAEGKLKNALEGLGLGVGAEMFVRGLSRAFRTSKAIEVKSGTEAATKSMNEEMAKVIDEMPEDMQLELFDEVSDPNIGIKAAGPSGVYKAGDAPRQPKAPEADTREVAGGVTQHNAKDVPKVDPKKPVDTGGLTRALEDEIEHRKMNPGGAYLKGEATGDLFNFDKMDSDISVKEVINMATDDIKAFGIKDRTTFDAIYDDAKVMLSDAVDVSPEVIDSSLRTLAKQAEDQQATVIAGKMLVQSLSRRVEDVAEKITFGRATDEDYNLMLKLQSRLVETSGNLKSVITGAAQTTAAGRIRTHDILTDAELSAMDIAKQLNDNIEGAGGRDAINKLAQAIQMNKNAKGGANGLMRISEGIKGPMGVINEVYINAILSGPKTHMINMASNAFHTALLPAEKMLGGALTANMDMVKEGARQYMGITLAVKDALKVAGTAWKSGRNVIDPEASILEANGNDFHAIKSRRTDVVGTLINTLGTVIRLHSRALLTSDEFFKQINYRASVYSRAMTEAGELVSQGKLPKKDASDWVQRKMDASVHKDGSATSQADLDFAREATFTQDLRKGSLSAGIQRMTNTHPALKLVLPFVRTPVNIVKASFQRTPGLNFLSKTMNADLRSADQSVRARAYGKLATGSLMWTTAVIAANEGKITGGGPTDPNARKLLMETGWRPYSIVINQPDGSKKYVEYRRMDPFGMFFGIAADITEIGGQIGEQDMSELVGGASIALANNLTSKTYLQGITEAVNAISDPERYGEGFVEGYASSLLPMSSLMREIRKADDPYMRDVNSLLDAVKNTVPGYSDALPLRRSWITGEPVVYPKGWGQDMVSPLGEAFASMNPVYEGTWKADPVLDELAKLDFGFTPPPRKVMGVDLTPEQYSRFVELNGTVRNGRYTMYQRLEAEFKKETYKGYPSEADPDLDPRIKVVKKVTIAYRKLAKAQLLEEYPELTEEVRGRAQKAVSNRDQRLHGIATLGQQ